LRILVIKHAPGIDEVRGYKDYFKLESRTSEYFLNNYGERAADLLRGGRMTQEGGLYIWGELQAAHEDEIDLEIITMNLLHYLLYSYRALSFRYWFGKIRVLLRVENVGTRKLQMRDIFRRLSNEYRLDGEKNLEITKEGIFNENPISALEICSNIVKDICLSFGFSSEISNGKKHGIDRYLVKTMMKNEMYHTRSHNYQNSHFPALKIDLSDFYI
jgi:hypothetical protein